MKRSGTAIGIIVGLFVIVVVVFFVEPKFLRTPQGDIKFVAVQYPEDVIVLDKQEIETVKNEAIKWIRSSLIKIVEERRYSQREYNLFIAEAYASTIIKMKKKEVETISKLWHMSTETVQERIKQCVFDQIQQQTEKNQPFVLYPVLNPIESKLAKIQFGIRNISGRKILVVGPFECPLTTKVKIQAVNGKFDHWEVFEEIPRTNQAKKIYESIDNPLLVTANFHQEIVAVFE